MGTARFFTARKSQTPSLAPCKTADKMVAQKKLAVLAICGLLLSPSFAFMPGMGGAGSMMPFMIMNGGGNDNMMMMMMMMMMMSGNPHMMQQMGPLMMIMMQGGD